MGNYSGLGEDYSAGDRCGAPKWALETKPGVVRLEKASQSLSMKPISVSVFLFLSFFLSRLITLPPVLSFSLSLSLSFIRFVVLLPFHVLATPWTNFKLAERAFEGVNIVPRELLPTRRRRRAVTDVKTIWKGRVRFSLGIRRRGFSRVFPGHVRRNRWSSGSTGRSL